MEKKFDDARLMPWLPRAVDWGARVKTLKSAPLDFAAYTALANSSMDFIECDQLDRAARTAARSGGAQGATMLKVAVLSSSTTSHLLAPIRVAAARRGWWAETYECPYGQYLQDLLDPSSGLHAFRPDVVVLSIDAQTLTAAAASCTTIAEAESAAEQVAVQLRDCWSRARDAFGAHVIQQLGLPRFEPLLGSNEHRLPASPSSFLDRVNAQLRKAADIAGVDVIAMDDLVRRDGLDRWFSPSLWHKAKQEVMHPAAPLYGEVVMRMVAARRGASSKCLVLDLDNTLWGGVIGDDGLQGIVLGQGSALGEAFLAIQAQAKELARRGVILAVVSKNDDANARAPFEQHPDMLLKLPDISCFVANWEDKASNLRAVAQRLNIGLDSLVFLDDNPFERNLVRGELPMVKVPELPDDPALYPRVLGTAGYFEAVAITDEDRARTALYRDNVQREALASQATDLPAYLKSLQMELHWGRFDSLSQQRVVQLINKTNQFNLTTRRYTDADYAAVVADPNAFGLHFRLTDRFGDNGIISIVVGRKEGADVLLDTWLMSCRVLGREVEQAVLQVVAAEAAKLGASRLIGEYRPTPKNQMVAGHYEKLGFGIIAKHDDGGSLAECALAGFAPRETSIKIIED